MDVVRRSTLLLSASQAANSATLQLNAAVASLTLARVLHVPGLLGLGPALVLISGAFAALPAGRAMDRHGRIPVLAAGFLGGIAGCLLAALGSLLDFAPLVLLGLVGLGIASGVALLTRTAAADLYPLQRRARGIGLVVFGAVFGAILGPAVFSPLVHGHMLDGGSLALLWSAGAGFMSVGLALVLAVRPDPSVIARGIPGARPAPAGPAVPLADLLRRPGVIPAMVSAQASFAVMVGLMTLTGAIVIDHQHHASHTVFGIIGAHVVGMYGLVLFVGGLVDRIGRRPALVGGLLVMAAAAVALGFVQSVVATAAVLFALGLGWNLSFVAATAILADATHPSERGRLLGFNDMLAGMSGASLALLGGLTLTELGVVALALGATVLVVMPALWISVRSSTILSPSD
jgi:MFS family permease